MTTKDEQPERLPMIIDALVRDDGHPSLMSAEQVRDHYESLITNGELMVVRTAKGVPLGMSLGVMRRCEHCTQPWTGPHSMSFCPGCGAKIIE